MSLIKGIPNTEIIDFLKLTDEELKRIRINTDLTSIEEVEEYFKEIKKRNINLDTE